MSNRRYVAGALAVLGFVKPALAVDLSDFGSDAIRTAPLDQAMTVTAKCGLIRHYLENAEAHKTCSGFAVEKLKPEAEAFEKVANEYLWASDGAAVGACEPVAPPLPDDANPGAANAAVEEARQNLEQAKRAATPDAKAITEAQAEFEKQEKAQKDAAAALRAHKNRRLGELQPTLKLAIAKFDEAVLSVEGRRDAKDFEAIAKLAMDAPEDEKAQSKNRADVCLELYRARLDVLGSKAAAILDRSTREAHEADTLRKTSGGSTVATLGSSFVEQPGSPDFVVYSLLTALGADEEVSGNQLSVSLNLSSLIWPDQETRLDQDVGFRNLFLRGMFPLNATTEATPAPVDEQPAVTDQVRRFSLVLGGSFFDETDTRLDANRRCYEAALAYASFAPTAEADDSRLVERQSYFDVCNHLVVNRSRLAWRAGVGFMSDQGDGKASTKPEMYAGVVVWAPTSQVYTNLIYQRFVRPTALHVGGAGISVAGNAGGGKSGATAWARVGLDTTFLLGHDPAGDETSWELRLAPTLRGRIVGDSVTALAIGPRILSRGSPELLATITFGYDADRIMNQLLTPLPSK